MKEIDKLFAAMTKSKPMASDLHLKVGSPPMYRIAGTVVRAKMNPFSNEQIMGLVSTIMGPDQDKELDEKGAADFAYSVRGVGRFRINVYKQRSAISMAARRVQTEIPTLDQLHLPPAVGKLSSFESGMALVAGVTGSGKSTTLAAVIQIINQTMPCHVVTIENPIEYLYKDDKSFINQREIGIDTPDFANALRHVLRQDPDVILVGEMRDGETIETALMSAETGHLVFGTVHSGSAAQTISRVLDYFPPERHHQIRQMLYFNLRAVMVQKLLKGLKPECPRVPAVELMFCNPSIKKAIFEKEDNKIGDIIRSARHEGMQDFNTSLMELVKTGYVAEAVALENSPNAEQLQMNLKGIVLGTDRGMITG
jgi:twitching motility protein PilT